MDRALRIGDTDFKKAEAQMALAKEAMTVDYKKALAHAQEAVFIARKEGSPALMSKAYNSLASVQFYMGLYDRAVVQFDKAAAEAEKAGVPIEAINNRVNISLIHIILGDFDKSIASLEDVKPRLDEAYRKAGKQFPIYDMITIHLNLGICYLGSGRYPKAHECLDSGIALARNVPDQRLSLFKLLVTKGKVKVKEGRFEEALSLMEEAEEVLADGKDLTHNMLLLQAKSEAYERKGDGVAALNTGKEGIRLSLALGHVSMMGEFAQVIVKVYRKTGPADSAVRYLDMVAQADSNVRSVRIKEELMRKELEQESVKMGNEFAERESKWKRRVLFGFAGTSLLGLASILGVLYYKKKYRRIQLQRLEQDVEARQLELERQRMQAELDSKDSELVRIGNELGKYGLIKALIGNLQSDDTTDISGKGADSPVSKTPKTADPKNRVWEEFEYRFHQIHSGFYDRLKQAYPDLTLNERRLCAFLRLDMATKEISDITGQSIRAIHMARIRLRRKFSLTHSDRDLYEFLSGL